MGINVLIVLVWLTDAFEAKSPFIPFNKSEMNLAMDTNCRRNNRKE